jgi:hypothetical protein
VSFYKQLLSDFKHGSKSLFVLLILQYSETLIFNPNTLIMKKTFTSFIRRLSFMLIFSSMAVAAVAQAYKPYPVYFPLPDYPEFEYGTKLATFTDAQSPSIHWSSNALGTDVWANTTTGAYKTAPRTAPNSNAFPCGRALSWACGYNRALYFDFKTPYLNPGTYRIYMSVAFDNGSTNRVGGNMYNIKLDNQLITMSDSTLTNRTLVNAVQLTGGNKQSVKFTGTGNKSYDAFLGTVTIPADSAKMHNLTFNLSSSGGASYAFSLMQFIPVTATNLDADYQYPMFDCAGNVFFQADSLKTINDVAVSGYYLPYQFADTTVYTKYDVNLDAGLYFANKMIVVKRADDKWTRLFSGTTDATGKITAKLPAGNYLVEINKALYSTTIKVTDASSFYVGVSTSTIHAQYSPEPWYVGKQFKVYNTGETILLYDFTIPADGKVPDFALPVDAVNAYKYYVKNTDGTTFDAGTILVSSTTDINLDQRATKQDVSINFGYDVYGNNQAFTIIRSSNANALYVSGTTSATGTFSVQLPVGTYYMASKSGLILKTFTVAAAAKTVDVSARYSVNFCPGKTVAGAKVNVYLASPKTLLSTVTIGADGKVVCPGLPNGRFFHNVYKVNGTDTTYIVKKFTFMIEGADFTIGNASNLEQPYYLPYKVYYDIASGQPELTWRTSTTILPGALKNVKCDNVAIDTIFVVKDTTWSVDHTTYTLNYDSTQISQIKYFDWALYYGFNGLTVPSTTANTYVWGDQFNFRLAPKHPLTFVTPNLNPGRYNVYMSNRWKPAGTSTSYAPTIDTAYMDGKALLVTDGIVRSFDGYGNSAVYRQFQTTNSAQYAMHIGEALVTKPGTHELSLYSILGSTGATANQGNTVWGGMIYFVPVDQDSTGINVTYYPRIDYAGKAVYRNAAEGNTTAQTDLGTDGVNKPKYFPQFADQSIAASTEVDYTKKLTVIGGIYSKNDVLTTVSPIDKWTTKSVVADTLGTAVLALNPKTDAYSWAMDVEGVHGTAVVNDNKTITIPTAISTVMTSTYTVTPSIDDETIGTYAFSTTIKTEPLPFYYPISGVVFYTKNSDIIKAAGDTLYKPKNEALNGISPVYSTDLPILPYTLASIYTGNGTRLQTATGTVQVPVGLKNTTVAAGIYPNPARETMNLKLNENAGVATFAIYNQLGQIVRRGSFTGTENSTSLNGVSRGLYIVKVNVNGKNWNTKLIVE